MRYTYYVSLSEDIYIQTYIAKITGSDPKYKFTRKFLNTETHDFKEERGYDLEICAEGIFEQCIKTFSKETNEILRQEKKWLAYDGNCMHEILRSDVLKYLQKLKQLAG